MNDITALREKARQFIEGQRAVTELAEAEADAARQAQRQQAEAMLVSLDGEFSADLDSYRQTHADYAAELARLETQFNRVVSLRRQDQAQADKLYKTASRWANQALYLTPGLSPLHRPGENITGEEIKAQAQQALIDRQVWPLMAVRLTGPNAGLVLTAIEQAAK